MNKYVGILVIILNACGTVCDANGSTATDAALNGSKIIKLIGEANVIGGGILVLDGLRGAAARNKLEQAMAVRDQTVQFDFLLNPKNYLKDDSGARSQKPVKIPYLFTSGARFSQNNLYYEYITLGDEGNKGVSVLFFAKQLPDGSLDYRFDYNSIQSQTALSLDDIKEVISFSANISFQSINQEISSGKSAFAKGYAITQIFKGGLLEAKDDKGAPLKPDTSDVAQNWLYSLPDGFFTINHKQALLVSYNIFKIHDPDLDEAWIYSINSDLIGYDKDDPPNYTYGKYILDLAFNMISSDFNNGHGDVFNATGQLRQLIEEIKDKALKQEELTRFMKLVPDYGKPHITRQ